MGGMFREMGGRKVREEGEVGEGGDGGEERRNGVKKLYKGRLVLAHMRLQREG